jgi:hypothetical protein
MGILDNESAQILGPDGTPVEKAAQYLTPEEAETFRQYQAFGEREGLKATMQCARCGSAMEVYVQGDIGLFCNCRVLLWKAS